MLRNVLRTSRWLVRRHTSIAPIFCRHSLNINNTLFNIETSINRINYSSQEVPPPDLDPLVFEKVCIETLESLSEYFEEIIDQTSNLKGADVTYSDGVLTVSLGQKYGTYVINRQSPNKQIWLSSPVSGPKRYDLILKDNGYWLYKHDGVTLHQLLQEEISRITKDVDFNTCMHALV